MENFDFILSHRCESVSVNFLVLKLFTLNSFTNSLYSARMIDGA